VALGTYGDLPKKLPAILGIDGFGIIKAKSSSSSLKDLQDGQKIVALKHGFGTWREYAILKKEEFIPINNKLSDLQAGFSTQISFI